MIFRRLKDLREDHDLKQAYLAKLLDVSQRSYSAYETGDRLLSIQSLMILADYYNVSIDYIVGRTDDPTPYPKKNAKKNAKKN